MKVDQKGHTSIIKDTLGNFSSFVEKIHNNYNTFKNQNLIIIVSKKSNITPADLKKIKDLATQHKKVKKSLVFVIEDIDYNTISKSLTVVPTILEAHDIIEMEEIERDLGF
ncbi:MAG TPA: ribonuclease Z [Flavobacterium sp.]|nr:ribonuclease Z [Flavobacterium sp.]